MKTACSQCGHPRPAIEPTRGVGEGPEGKADGEATSVRLNPSETTPDTSSPPSGPTVERAIMSGEPDLGSAELKTDKVDPIAKCAHCRDLDLPFDRVVTCWAYQGAVCDVIVTAKYAHQAPLGDALGRRLGARVYEQLAGDLPSIVTFVPSHYSRQLMRGGIGNLAIAEGIAKCLSTESGALQSDPVQCRQLLRTTSQIKKQAWLDDQERRENVRDAFAVKRGYPFAGLPKLANQHILLVDDVLTTGATASEVTRVLVNAGVSRVTLAVLARAIRTN